tara:strand:- start:29 stop:613 length:585 start_codon:yes stop_codon:yes gene_type:complete
MKKKVNSIKESTLSGNSPGVKGYTAYTPSEKWPSYKNKLTKIVKKTTGYEMIGDKRIPSDTINKSDNPINNEPVSDKNISPKKMEFKSIKESISIKRVTVSEIKKWMKGLEENKWRKTYNVDARRVAHFVNFGEGVELSKSLQKKSKNANYKREVALAEKYIKHLKGMEKNRKNVKMNESSLRQFIKNKIRDLI